MTELDAAAELFPLGVRNYVGTAWEAKDLGATMFAKTLYAKLLWAAYQHYGDSTSEGRLSVAIGGD